MIKVRYGSNPGDLWPAPRALGTGTLVKVSRSETKALVKGKVSLLDSTSSSSTCIPDTCWWTDDGGIVWRI